MACASAPEVRGYIAERPNAAASLAVSVALILHFWCVPVVAAGNKAVLAPDREGALPLFVLKDSTGQPRDLEAHRGRPVLVHFFATWCEPCRDELPALNRLVERAPGRTLTVLAVSVSEPELRVMRFLEATPLAYPVLLDTDGGTARAWRIRSLPTTVVLDSELRPNARATGEVDWDAVDPAGLGAFSADAPATDLNAGNQGESSWTDGKSCRAARVSRRR